MKTNKDGHVVPAHIEDEDLVAYLDGESDLEMQRATQTHLESCWYCRGRLSSVERSIESFLKLRHDELLPAEIPPAGPSLDLFKSRLAAHQLPAPSSSFARQLWPSLRSHLNRVSDVLTFSNYSLRTQLIASRALATLVMASIVAGLILFSGRERTVSAAKLLNLSIEAQAQRLNEIEQPVLHQRIRVKTPSGQLPVVWEIWNDTANSRVSMNSSDPTGSELVTNLRAILRDNNMNEHRALSAASFKAWSDSIDSKSEDVVEGTDVDVPGLLTVRTLDNGVVGLNGITYAALSIRESDYHPVSLFVNVRTADGERRYELVEQDYEIVSLNELDPSIFGDPTKVETASTVGVPTHQELPIQSPDSIAAEVPKENLNPDFPKATTADEVEVLDLLHRAGADITEQLTVTRAADGRLLIEGLVESDSRKTEILEALSPVSKNSSVRIRVQTIEEATRALKQQKAQNSPEVVDLIQVEKGTIAADADLRKVLGNDRGDVDAEIARFASRMVARSQSALFQASALNRVSNRFSPTELAEMDKESRSKWLGILKDYAAAVRRDTASMRADLQTVFGGLGSGADEAIASDADLIASARRLYEATAANDRAVRAAFMLSSAGGSASAVKSGEFRRSVALAEALAEAIEKFK